jgi:hypothetical protein
MVAERVNHRPRSIAVNSVAWLLEGIGRQHPGRVGAPEITRWRPLQSWYLTDMGTGYWFKPKSFGYGATPVTWRGWAWTLGNLGCPLCLALPVGDLRVFGSSQVYFCWSTVTYATI